MPIFSNANKNILFIHIPKCGGSSIERIARSLGWAESLSIRGKSRLEIQYFKSSLQHLHAEPLQLLLNLEVFDKIFTVVRNPFSRIKSEYYWQRSNRTTELDVDEWLHKTFEAYAKDPHVYDNHIRPQIEFIPHNDNVNVKIFKLEEGGIDSAKQLLLDGVPTKSAFTSLKEGLARRKIPNEKRSVKDSIIEKKFEKHYQSIVDFYMVDYSSFSYEY